MDNPFHKIVSEVEPPKSLKRQVMNSANYAKLLADMAELFSSMYIQTFGNLFSTEEGKKSTTKTNKNK